MEVPAPFAGVIDRLAAEPGQVIKVGDAVLSYKAGNEKDGEAATEDRAPSMKTNNVEQPRRTENARLCPSRHRACRPPHWNSGRPPSVRFMARKLGVDLAKVPGSGPGGGLLDDPRRTFKQAPAPAKPPVPDMALDVGKPGTRIKLQGIRRKIAEHMCSPRKRSRTTHTSMNAT